MSSCTGRLVSTDLFPAAQVSRYWDTASQQSAVSRGRRVWIVLVSRGRVTVLVVQLFQGCLAPPPPPPCAPVASATFHPQTQPTPCQPPAAVLALSDMSTQPAYRYHIFSVNGSTKSSFQKWLEMQSSSSSSSPQCEICHFQFRRHKQIKVERRRRNVFKIFVLTVASLQNPFLLKQRQNFTLGFLPFNFDNNCVFCSCDISVQPGKQEAKICRETGHIQPLPINPEELSATLSVREILSMLGGVFIFIAFFVAMYAEGSADLSLLQVFSTLYYHYSAILYSVSLFSTCVS